MLTKDKKPDEKDAAKEAIQVIPARPDTPKMFKAALKVTEHAGIEGALSKLRQTYKPSEGSEVSCCCHSAVTPLVGSRRR